MTPGGLERNNGETPQLEDLQTFAEQGNFYLLLSWLADESLSPEIDLRTGVELLTGALEKRAEEQIARHNEILKNPEKEIIPQMRKAGLTSEYIVAASWKRIHEAQEDAKIAQALRNLLKREKSSLPSAE